MSDHALCFEVPALLKALSNAFGPKYSESELCEGLAKMGIIGEDGTIQHTQIHKLISKKTSKGHHHHVPWLTAKDWTKILSRLGYQISEKEMKKVLVEAREETNDDIVVRGAKEKLLLHKFGINISDMDLRKIVEGVKDLVIKEEEECHSDGFYTESEEEVENDDSDLARPGPSTASY